MLSHLPIINKLIIVASVLLLSGTLFAQDKKLTLSEMKKDLIIFKLKKENLELKYRGVTASIKQLERRIKKAEDKAKKKKEAKE